MTLSERRSGRMSGGDILHCLRGVIFDSGVHEEEQARVVENDGIALFSETVKCSNSI